MDLLNNTILKNYLYFPIRHSNIEAGHEERKDAQQNGANLAQWHREGSFHIWFFEFQANEGRAENNSVAAVENGLHLDHDVEIE